MGASLYQRLASALGRRIAAYLTRPLRRYRSPSPSTNHGRWSPS